MDPALEQVVLGVLANGLTAVFERLSREAQPVAEATVAAAVGDEFDRLAGVPLISDSVGGEPLREFLLSTEAQGLVRQVYGSRLIGEDGGLLELRTQFQDLCELWTGVEGEEVRVNAGRLFDVVRTGADATLSAALETSELRALEAKAALRQRELIDELAGIRALLDVSTARDTRNVTEFVSFGERLRNRTAERNGRIVPPNFDAVRQIPIDDLYVAPQIEAIAQHNQGEAGILDLEELLQSLFRGVILGNPGSGKTTLARKLCHGVARGELEGSTIIGGMVPLLVVLRDYGAAKFERRVSVVQFIEEEVNSVYQIAPPEGAIEYLLLSGRAFVLFDGLDELLETADRQEVTEAIENFCDQYPSAPTVVTSREVGYQQAPLGRERFDLYRLADFDVDRVSTYVTKWFTLEPDLGPAEIEGEVASFMRDSELVADLRSNPLMLALMCNIYRGEGYIPDNRPEVYEKCAVMLFERWDKNRRILVPLEFDRLLRPAMQYLAHWIYSEPTLQAGVTERDLVTQATAYLAERRFEDEDEARQEARRFVEFCSGRAWVFTDTGTTSAGESLYQFTHRTFLEFFAAEHLVRTHRTPGDLSAALLPRVSRGEWDVVAQLAFQLQDRNLEGAADELLTDLLSAQPGTSASERGYRLSFAARCLGFLVPTPATTRAISGRVVHAAVTAGVARLRGEDPAKANRDQVAETLAALLQCNWENRSSVSRAIEGTCVEAAQADDRDRAMAALDIGLHLDEARSLSDIGRGSLELREVWRGSAMRIAAEVSETIRRVARERFGAAYDALCSDLIGLSDLISWHGFAQCFEHRGFLIYRNRIKPPIYELLLLDITQPDGPRSTGADHDLALERLRQFSEAALTLPPPWFVMNVTRFGSEHVFNPGFDGAEETLDGDAMFGLFIACAVVTEAGIKSGELDRILPAIRATGSAFEPVLPLLETRTQDGYAEPPTSFSTAQASLAASWASGEVSFGQRPEA